MDIFVNYATLVAFVGYSVGLIIQILKLVKIKKSDEISVWEITLRYLSGIILLIKVISIRDVFLAGGQGAFTILFSVYVFLVIKYRVRSRNEL